MGKFGINHDFTAVFRVGKLNVCRKPQEPVIQLVKVFLVYRKSGREGMPTVVNEKIRAGFKQVLEIVSPCRPHRTHKGLIFHEGKDHCGYLETVGQTVGHNAGYSPVYAGIGGNNEVAMMFLEAFTGKRFGYAPGIGAELFAVVVQPDYFLGKLVPFSLVFRKEEGHRDFRGTHTAGCVIAGK